MRVFLILMLATQQSIDTSLALVLQPHRQGVRLRRPESAGKQTGFSIADLYRLPVAIYFLHHDGRIVGANEQTAEIAGMQSISDLLGRSSTEICSSELSAKLRADEVAVLASQSMKVTEDNGEMANGAVVKSLSFLLPWYDENNVVGLLGCSLATATNAMQGFSSKLARLMATGLFGSAAQQPLPNNKVESLSKRENEILSLLVRGKTAKEIGLCLEVSRRTVENHLANIKVKTRTKSRSELVDKYVDSLI